MQNLRGPTSFPIGHLVGEHLKLIDDDDGDLDDEELFLQPKFTLKGRRGLQEVTICFSLRI